MLSFKKSRANIATQEFAQLLPHEWAEAKRILPKQFTAKAGKLDYSYSPYLIEIVNNFAANSKITSTSILKGSQVGATQLVIETILGYTIDIAPTSILYLSESKIVAETDVSTRIDNMLYTTGIYDKIRPSAQFKHGKKTGNTKSVKEFAGGIIYAKGANEKPIAINAQILIFDELDKAKKHKFGDMVSLWKKRLSVYGKSKKELYSSTPQGDTGNRIYKEFLKGDQRYWFCECPSCKNEFSFSWSGNITKENGLIPDGVHNFKYTKNEQGAVIPESIGYACRNCGYLIKEEERYNVLLTGKWIATTTAKFRNSRSYYVPQFMSNFVSWEDICNEFIEAQNDRDRLKVFVNEVCAQVWEDRINQIDTKTTQLINAKSYAPLTIPNKLANDLGHGNIVMLTAGIDINKGSSGDETQGWAAITICGWTADNSCFVLAKGHIYGTIYNYGNVWKSLDEIINLDFYDENGVKYYINCVGVDSGYNPDKNVEAGKDGSVFDFVNKNNNARAIKGEDKISKKSLRFATGQTSEGLPLYLLDTTRYKTSLFNNLLISENADETQPPEFVNFPKAQEIGGLEYLNLNKKYKVAIKGNGFDESYYKTFNSEEPIFNKDKTEIILYKKINTRAPTHDLDALIYATAAKEFYASEILSVIKEKTYNLNLVLKYLEKFLAENGYSF